MTHPDAPPVDPTERARTQEAIRAIWRKHWASFSLIAKPLWDELDAAIRDDERTAALAEIARLTAALDEQHKATDDLWNERTTLRAERDALARDAERLDWLDSEHRRFDPVAALTVKYKLDRTSSEWVNVVSPVRAALDAARSAAPATEN